jgi:hypothetical protein
MSNPAAGLVSSFIGWLRRLLGGGEGERGVPAPDRGGGRIAIEEIAPGDGPAWGTLSGLAAHPANPRRLFACTDQDSPPARILEIDVSRTPARVVRQIEITVPGVHHLDIEGISAKRDGGFWLASEGGDYNDPPNLLLEVDAAGRLIRAVVLPAAIVGAVQKKGLEGVAVVERASGTRLYVAFQGPLADDPADLTRIAEVDPASGTWRFWHYPLDETKDDGLTGLSEIAHLGGSRFAAIERDGKGGRKSIKWLTTFSLDEGGGAATGGTPPLLSKRVALDLVPLFLDRDMKVEKEIEGLTIAADGQVYVLNDNDGERPTLLLRLGNARDLFG